MSLNRPLFPGRLLGALLMTSFPQVVKGFSRQVVSPRDSPSVGWPKRGVSCCCGNCSSLRLGKTAATLQVALGNCLFPLERMF